MLRRGAGETCDVSFAVTYVIVLVHVCIHAIHHVCYLRPHGRIEVYI